MVNNSLSLIPFCTRKYTASRFQKLLYSFPFRFTVQQFLFFQNSIFPNNLQETVWYALAADFPSRPGMSPVLQ